MQVAELLMLPELEYFVLIALRDVISDVMNERPEGRHQLQDGLFVGALGYVEYQ